MKSKKLALALATCSIATLMSGVQAFAVGPESQGKEVPVSYDNTVSIPDPENPANAKWAVTIPSAITFTDAVKDVDASVELVAKNGGSLTGLNIAVNVQSTNGFKLDGAEQLDYQVAYGQTILNSTTTGANKTKIATLTEDAAKQDGLATLTGVASKAGSFTDTLTYTVQKQ